ncbi:odorant receptor 13a-like isoform X1 [Venturia canescens]|uniref:odorant receptor 13a-like isoform X1 n=1 Tax=Venturia canescens TaxID=32260 RepID=UPI001C9C42A5|nr:odorant receptor 13a-like isoform X1 [Venturia canescens]
MLTNFIYSFSFEICGARGVVREVEVARWTVGKELRTADRYLSNFPMDKSGASTRGREFTPQMRVICFLVNHKELVDLHRTLEKYFDETLNTPQVQIFDSLSVFVKPSFAITILVFIGTLVFFITPLIVIIVQLSSDMHPLKFVLPYPGKYPWSFEGGGFVYYVHYAWEILAGLYLFCVTSGVDSLFGYYVFQIHAIFRLMSHRMRSVGVADQDNGKIIRECVKMHRVLGQCRDQLQAIYGPIVFWIFLTSAVIMCTLIFQASQTRQWTVGYAILFTVYISMKLLQALMYAWYGSIVHAESEDFRDAVYNCGWPGSGDTSLMNNILIMMCHQPMVLTACKFLIISTDMFTAIVNATMSYFFLLQTLDERK